MIQDTYSNAVEIKKKSMWSRSRPKPERNDSTSKIYHIFHDLLRLCISHLLLRLLILITADKWLSLISLFPMYEPDNDDEVADSTEPHWWVLFVIGIGDLVKTSARIGMAAVGEGSGIER